MVNAIQKGKRVEREVAQLLNKLLPGCNARRTQQYCGKEGTSDVTAEGPLANWHIESKGYSFPYLEFKQLGKWLDQTRRDASEGAKRVIFVKLIRQDFLCVVPYKHCSISVSSLSRTLDLDGWKSVDYNGLLSSIKILRQTNMYPFIVNLDSNLAGESVCIMTPEQFARMVS